MRVKGEVKGWGEGEGEGEARACCCGPGLWLGGLAALGGGEHGGEDSR